MEAAAAGTAATERAAAKAAAQPSTPVMGGEGGIGAGHRGWVSVRAQEGSREQEKGARAFQPDSMNA